MEPTFEDFLAAMNGGGDRSPAGVGSPLVMAPSVLNDPSRMAAFQQAGLGSQAQSLTPAAKAALMKRLAPKLAASASAAPTPAAASGPPSPLATKAVNAATAQNAGRALVPGQNVTTTDRTEDKFSRQDNEPYNMTTRDITGVEPPDDNPTAFGDHLQKTHIGFDQDGKPVFHNLLRGSVGPSLRALKSQLPEYQAARAQAQGNPELRAKLAPLMASNMSLAPFLSYINSVQGTNIQEAPQRAPGLGAQFLKEDNVSQDNSTQLAALENKLIDQISIPKGTVFQVGSGTTQGAVVQPPKPIKGGGKGVNQKDIDAYNKMTAGGSAMLNSLQSQEQALKTIPDDYNHSLGSSLLNKLKYAASDVVGDNVLDENQKKLDAARSTILQQVNSALGLHRWNPDETRQLKKTIGVGETATKEKVLEGLNYVRSLEKQAYLDAEAAHPEGADVMQSRGRPGSKDFHGLTSDDIKSGFNTGGGDPNYDGSTPLNAGASPDMKSKRIQFLKAKSGAK